MKLIANIFCCSSLIVLLLMTSCSKNSGKSAPESGDGTGSENLTKAEVVRGPLTFRLKVSQDKISFTDQLKFIMEASAPEKYSFQFPPFGEGLQEQFGIVDYQTETPLLSKDRVVSYRRTYILEPILEGTHKIPAFSVTFQENSPRTKKHILETEPFNLEVTMPPAEFWQKLNIDDQTDMTPAESLRPPRSRSVYGIGAAVLILALGITGLALAIRRHRRQKQAPPEIPAHIIALQELKQLLDDDLTGKNQLKEFYERISAILRKYIENRFQVKAPELTTEEFLLQLTTAQNLLKQHRKLLTSFLQFCDMVKFARHQPDTQDIQQTFDACKSFIAATQEAIES